MTVDDDQSPRATESASKEELARGREASQKRREQPSPAHELERGEQVGPYRIRRRIGRGGMGEVYEAEQLEPVRRHVALKVIRWGLDSDEMVARFETERQALALMDHPNIAHVLDAGATDRGRPYFVMEFVKGVPLHEYCDTQRLDTRQRLELFMQICEAVQHAHQKGIIHRDLKPTNILVETHGERAVPKIIDFGVAKATSQKLTEHSVFTEFGQLIGTPEFMSPEQAEMSGLDVDTRTDVYALGVVLYWLLAGVLPFEPDELRANGLDEIRRKIREEEPPRPSTALSKLGDKSVAVATKRRSDPRKLSRSLRGDLDWIVMKALEKDRTRRYSSASEMSADIGRHLRNEPVLAGPPTSAYRIRKFVTRHRGAVVSAAVLVFLLVAFSITVSVQSLRIARERDRAQAEAEKALAFKAFIERTLLSPDPVGGLGVDATIIEALERATRDLEETLKGTPEAEAAVRYALGMAYFKLGRFAEADPLLRVSLRARRELLEEPHVDIADAAFAVGDLEAVQGNYEAAERLLLESVSIRRRLGGDGDQKLAFNFERLALLYRDLGRLDEAEEMVTEAIEIRRTDSASPLELAGALSIQGILAYGRGDNDAAEELYLEALRLRRAQVGDRHVTVAESLSNLAIVFESKGDIDRAAEMYREAITLMRELYDGNTTDLAAMIGNLAMLIGQRGDDDDEADRLYREALEIDREVLGPDNVNISIDLMNLASFLVERRRFPEAERSAGEALVIMEAALGPDHWILANARSIHGAALTGLGRHADAEGELLRAANGLEEEFGAVHERTVRVWRRLAELYDAWGKPAEAAAYRNRSGG